MRFEIDSAGDRLAQSPESELVDQRERVLNPLTDYRITEMLGGAV